MRMASDRLLKMVMIEALELGSKVKWVKDLGVLGWKELDVAALSGLMMKEVKLASLNPLHSFLNQILLHRPHYFVINLIYCLLVLSNPPSTSRSIHLLSLLRSFVQIAFWDP